MAKNDPVESFEDLLGSEDAPPVEEEASAAKSAAQQRIEDLKQALLNTPEPEPEAAEPSEEELEEIKDLEDQIAKRNNARITSAAPAAFSDTSHDEGKDVLVIHFLEDGFSAFGAVWSKGQEIEIVKGSPEWNRTLDINGESWLDLVNNPQGQRRKWGKIFFAQGEYEWVEGEEFDVLTAKADVRRRRGVPLP